MVRVAPINLQYNPRTLWFDPGELDIKRDDPVVVLTARGVEFGRASGDIFEVDQAEIKKLKCSLKPVKRIATEQDEEKAAEMERKSAEALPIFKEMAAETNEDMRPVSVEYLLEGDKAVFYFEAEDRVDFRDLVRKLASRFHVRIDMRQIGVRDEARMVGGYGHCGQELCCRRLGGGFCPVSIRMAKEQDLSLNPQKISGVCGRLMCCLRYEYDAYKDFKSRAPKQNATVQTPDGPAKVVDLDVPREIVSLKIEGEKAVKIPLADMETKGDAARPNFVGEEAWERANMQTVMPLAGSSTFSTSLFTGDDKLAQAGSVRHTGGGRAGSGRARKEASASSIGDALDAHAKRDLSRKPRRRSTKVGGDATQDSSASKQKQRGAQTPSKKNRNGKKPQMAEDTQRRQPAGAGTGAQRRAGGKDDARSRRAQSASRDGRNTSPARDSGASGRPNQGPRPGQKSSGLRQKPAPKHAADDSSRTPRRSSTFSAGERQTHTAHAAESHGGAGLADGVRSGFSGAHAAPNGNQGGAKASAQGNGSGRRTRRRSHKAGGQTAAGRSADGDATRRDARGE